MHQTMLKVYLMIVKKNYKIRFLVILIYIMNLLQILTWILPLKK